MPAASALEMELCALRDICDKSNRTFSSSSAVVWSAATNFSFKQIKTSVRSKGWWEMKIFSNYVLVW